ncbi:adenylate/guanylate cyclase domain-containing protein [Flavobacterium sp. F-65]|uniref:Adenylate/guanylate cyclase domain-containing protein n=1 Tax=Flavobacterium pisciphilum TaxID=2893755 RepID=A0ABS8MS79_9FLAO|nr:adenylate/guanylate cyclase domain-containing protein [Flavobacterium sp. F-65]MCC9070770.1 adenylate/guanylate cyclase domain-containing protein [Flavobacterium sp. F-65]
MKYKLKTVLKIIEYLQLILLWILAFLYYVFLTYSIIDEDYIYQNGIKASDFLVSELIGVLFVGTFMGTIFFLLQEYVFCRFFQKYGILITVLFQTILFIMSCFVVLLMLIGLNKADYITINNFFLLQIDFRSMVSFIFYCLVVHVFITLIHTFRRRLGRNYFKSLLQGKYITPVIEYRAFMFLDMYDSSAVAENVGHYNYSLLLQECFADLSELLINHGAEIYQYVGDEAVITWKISLDFDRQKCIDLYNAFSVRLLQKQDFYQNKFGLVPKFKGSVNEGLVTVAEIGQIKTEIAYHGDVLTTAARVRNLCNDYQADLLITQSFFEQLLSFEQESFTAIDRTILRGKKKPITIYKSLY